MDLMTEMMAEQLESFEMFSDLPAEELARGAPFWANRQVAPGTGVWLHGEKAQELALVLRGRLIVKIAEKEVGEIEDGEMAGEAAAFFGEHRTATVVAATDTFLLVLTTRGLVKLRDQCPQLYDRILEHTLNAMALRIQETGRRIAQLATGSKPEVVRARETSFGRFLRKLENATAARPPTAAKALRTLPGLGNADLELIEPIQAALTARRIPAGQPVFLQGEDGQSVYLLVEGRLQIIRSVFGEKGEKLADLKPGALFGTGSVLLEAPRNASCVAGKSPCWVYEMSAPAYRALSGEPGRRWREVMLVSLWYQQRGANEQLVALKRGGSKVKESDYQRAQAWIETFQGSRDVVDPLASFRNILIR